VKNAFPAWSSTVGYGQKHGVEIDAPTKPDSGARQAPRRRLEPVTSPPIAGLTRKIRRWTQKTFANAKRGIGMAAEMQCPVFRFVAKIFLTSCRATLSSGRFRRHGGAADMPNPLRAGSFEHARSFCHRNDNARVWR
jgi:hypothetical protein